MSERARVFVAVLGGLLVCACTAEFGVETGNGNLSQGLGSLDDQNDEEADEGEQGEAEDLPTPEANLEACGNDLDDDGDGATDEDCGCEPGTERVCYLGPAEVRGIGACAEGLQACDDSQEFPEFGDCVGSVQPAAEIVGNGVDDDCDGLADCEDTQFAEDPICLGPCGAQTETYHDRLLGPGWGGSSIERGDGLPEQSMTCEDTACDPEQAAFEAAGQVTCVAPPPECAEGTYPTYHADTATWTCDPPCDLIIHYGAIFGNATECAENPDLVCPDGTVPTWVFETETWECRPTCDNGMYDQIWVDGALFCVPC